MPFLKGKAKIPRSQQLDNSAKKNGPRHAIFNVIGDKYIGEWKDDFKEGKGILLTVDHRLYEGDFGKGYRDGFGVLAYEFETKLQNKIFKLDYRGNWKKGWPDGYGMRKYRDGGVYIGNWKRGKRHGYGCMWYPDGDFYSGDWVTDKRQGLGMLVKPNSNRYEGNWFNDLKHGKGRYIHLATGQMQIGVWFEDVCIFCTFHDIRYRQTSIYATKYPIHQNTLLNMDEICMQREIDALTKTIHSCLSLHDIISSEMSVPLLDI